MATRAVVKSSLDTTRLGIGVVLLVGTLVLTYVYWAAHAKSDRSYDSAPEPFSHVPVTPELLAEGERLARIRGCFWCHDENLSGKRYFASASRGIILSAPNLPLKTQDYSDAELAMAIRRGIRPDGTSVWPAMPAFAYYHLSDGDVGAIIAYIRSLPVQDGFLDKRKMLPLGWFRMLNNEIPLPVAELVDYSVPRQNYGQKPLEIGAYLAETVCTECHSDNGRLRVPITPDLDIVRGYTREQFVRLMRKGIPIAERIIDIHMVEVAKHRYTAMHDEEIDALYLYLTRPVAADID
jgi:mono/diheme cytochrome c family protein